MIVFPVYCATVTKSESTYSNERISQFGEPIILALPRKDANKPDVLYHLISQHVERYTQFKLFEEVKEDESDPFEDPVNTEDEPPNYDQVIEEETNNEFTESASSVVEFEEEMDVDSEQPQNLIHTAAAVTPAGGKRIEPMSNLFAMKVFSEPRYRRAEELLPSVTTWSGLVDLAERAKAEQEQREEYERQQQESETESEHDTEMEDSVVLPAKISDEEEVEDAATLFSSTIKQDEGEETEAEANDHDSTENASYHSDNNSEHSAPGPIAAPAAPPALPKRKVTCPPSTIIRQGEGILLEWTPKKAKQLFGSSRHHADESGVCTDAWEDMQDLGDPNDDGMAQAQQKKQITLSDCLDEFTKEEELSGEDLWYCPKCKKHQRATKKFDLWRMPEIMVVHLKRFSHSRTWRDKIDALIDFPTSELDLTDRVLSIEDHTLVSEEDRLVYDLYGVDNHYGGLGGGHCTYTKH